MNLTWELIKEVLKCSEYKARGLLREYKNKLKVRYDFILLDNKSIPAWFFIIEYSKNSGLSENELCRMFQYNNKLLVDYKKFIKEKETETNEQNRSN